MGTPSDARPAQRVASGAGLLPCPDCGREFQGRAGSLSMVTACSRRPTIKIMCLSREGKHAGTEKKVLLARGQIIMLEAGIVVNSNTLAEKLLG